MNEKQKTKTREEVWAKNWQPFLNVAQLIDMELEIARTCQQLPVKLLVGRKQWYELRRDWAHLLETRQEDDPINSSNSNKVLKTFFNKLEVELIDATDRLVLITKDIPW